MNVPPRHSICYHITTIFFIALILALPALPFFIPEPAMAAGGGSVNIVSPSGGDTLGSGPFAVTVSYVISDLSSAKNWEIALLVINPVILAQQNIEINPVTILNFGQRKQVPDNSGVITFNDSFEYGVGDPEDLTVTAMLIAWTDIQGTGVPSEVARDELGIHFIPTPGGNNSPLHLLQGSL